MVDAGASERENGCPPQCGYGLLGLCCHSCLQGPCRRSPFGAEGDAGFCGEDRDWIVTRNLIDRVSRETLQAMASFQQGLERLFRPANGSGTERLAEMEALLSPFSGEDNAPWERILPERAFPLLHALTPPAGSWCAALLAMAARETHSPGEIEGRLAGALGLAAMGIAAEALRREAAGAAPAEADPPLPAAAAPLLLLISGGGATADGDQRRFAAIEAACRESFRVERLSDISRLPAVGRTIRDRWGIPASRTGSIAVVASSSLVDGLGALALGFSVAAVPAYPIHGSRRVERYLTEHLQETAGNAYLPVWDQETLVEPLLERLKR